MNVLHINGNYLYTNLHQCMMRALTKAGVSNQVYAPVAGTKATVVTPDANVLVSKCFRKWDRIFFDYKQHKILCDIQKKIDIRAFDCIHAYTLFTDGNSARKLSKKYNVPYVVAVRNTDVNTFFRRMIHLRSRGVQIMRDAKAVFFLSESYRKQVFEQYVPAQYREELMAKTYVIPNGIDDFWLEQSWRDRKPIDATQEIKLIYAGRIDRNKNIPTTQRAMHILRERGYRVTLTVVGRVDDQAEYEKIRADQNTTCLPAMPKEQLIDHYRAADIFVMPSFCESFGLVYAEAMSQGLPVIYSKGQGFDGQFPDGEVGYAVRAKSPEEIVNAVELIFKNHNVISERCIRDVNRFDWNVIVNDYMQLYNDILSHRN